MAELDKRWAHVLAEPPQQHRSLEAAIARAPADQRIADPTQASDVEQPQADVFAGVAGERPHPAWNRKNERQQ
jgi:hypothetical protein